MPIEVAPDFTTNSSPSAFDVNRAETLFTHIGRSSDDGR
jgi:hypothetical protein